MNARKLSKLKNAISDDIAIIKNPQSDIHEKELATWRLNMAGKTVLKSANRVGEEAKALFVASGMGASATEADARKMAELGEYIGTMTGLLDTITKGLATA